MARDSSDFSSYCNDLLNEPNSLMNFDALSHDRPMEPLVYYDLQPVSKPKEESSQAACSMQSSSRLPTSTAEVNMDMCDVEHLKYKRKRSVQGIDFDDDNHEDSRSIRKDDKKHNHSEIEKRRRDKMNSYITELASMIPICNTKSRKLDKLSVLRMAVQQMKTIRGTVTPYTEGHYKSPFLSDQDLKNLITQAAEGFVFAVSCDHGKILYVSKSVTQILNYLPEDLVGNNVFDYIHPKDVAKVKDQLSSSDFGLRDRYTNGKTMSPIRAEMITTMSKMCSGARRSFFCRMKCKVYTVKELADTTTDSKYTQSDRRYSVIQCTGYLKPWAQMNDCDNISGKCLDQGDDNDGNGVRADSESANNVSCLVAVGRIINTQVSTSNLSDIVKPPCFTSKYTIDGKFLSVDQRVTYIVGFLPQELLGTSMYEYFHPDDISRLVDIHKATLQECKPKNTDIYKFRAKDKTYVHLLSEWKSFRNPWTKEIEFIVANNILTRSDYKPDSSNKPECSSQSRPQNNHDVFTEQQLSRIQQKLGNREIQNMISSHLEANKIGRHIADMAMDAKKKYNVDSNPSDYKHDIKAEAFDNDGLRYLQRTPLSALNVPGTSSGCTVVAGQSTATADGGRGDAYAAVIHDTANNKSSSTGGGDLDHHSPSSAALHPANAGHAIPGGHADDVLGNMMTPSPQPLSSSDNDDAAMAVIMSLLEADAGLGGPVDFAGLPWPLP